MLKETNYDIEHYDFIVSTRGRECADWLKSIREWVSK
jgi:hypothetical protein